MTPAENAVNTKESPVRLAFLIIGMAIGIYIAILAAQGQASNKLMLTWIIPFGLFLIIAIYNDHQNKKIQS